jgi:hypothetical protein
MNRSLSNQCCIAALAAATGVLPVLAPAAKAQDNTYYGTGALESGSVSGLYDAAFGYDSLFSNTTGAGNTAMGVNSLYTNKTGSYNTAYGQGSLGANTTGPFNTAIGSTALRLNTTGTANVAIGYAALYSCSTDGEETATGYEALFHDSTSDSGVPNGNVADGYEALWGNTSGYDDTATGYEALLGNKTGFENTANGSLALFSNQSGYLNVAIGNSALYSNTSGYVNVATGVFALYSNTSGIYNTAYGYTALYVNTTGAENVAEGAGALSEVTTGAGNIGIGFVAGGELTTGSNNIDIGNEGSSSDNAIIRIGDGATQTDTYLTGVIHGNGSGLTGLPGVPGFSTAGSGDLAVGLSALSSNTGYGDTASGASALKSNSTGDYNVGDGAYAIAGGTVTGNDDVGVGSFSLYALTTGNDNDAMGFDALYYNSTGYDNIAIGSYALYENTAGYENTGVGVDALENLSSGYNNTAFGAVAGSSLVSGDNNIYLGTSGITSSENYVMRLGSNQTTTYIAGTTVGFNNYSPTAGTLDFGGGYIIAEGKGGVRPYIGDDGSGSDVQIGSYKSGITAVACYNEADNAYMHLYCSSISIEGGSDLAEPFKVSQVKQPVVEGDVVVIDDANPGQLTLTDQPYDTRVAGVVSGANGIHPGIQMQQQGVLDGGKNVALTGRVYVRADTSNGPIHPGNMLTTSGTPGRAMRVTDHARAQGAILGKAMTRLDEGQGMVLVLVTLQ